jgi:hypothetical protein
MPRPSPTAELVYTEDGFKRATCSCRLKSGRTGWPAVSPGNPISEVVSGSGGKAHVLTTNRNLLIVADVLIVHRGFARAGRS